MTTRKAIEREDEVPTGVTLRCTCGHQHVLTAYRYQVCSTPDCKCKGYRPALAPTKEIKR